MKMDLHSNIGELTLDCLPPEIIIRVFAFLDPRYLAENVSKVCSKFSCLLSDEAYWKIRIFRKWPSKYPSITPTLPIDWIECAIEREEMVRRYGSRKNKLISIVEANRHYAACDTILIMPVPDRHLVVSGSRDRSLVLWDVRGDKPSGNTAWSRVVAKNAAAHNGWVWSLSSNGTSRLASCGWDNMIHLWNVSNRSLDIESEINTGSASPCLDIAFLNDIVTVGTFDRRVKSYDLRSSNRSNYIEQYSHHKKAVLAVHVPKHHQEFLISASEDGLVTLIDRRAKKITSTLKFTDGFPMCMDMVDGDNCLYVGDKSGNLHLIEISNGILNEVKCVEKLHNGKIHNIDASKGGIVTCSSDKTVKILHPDISMDTIKTIDEEKYGEVTAVSHWRGVLAMAHSEEVIRFYDQSEF